MAQESFASDLNIKHSEKGQYFDWIRTLAVPTALVDQWVVNFEQGVQSTNDVLKRVDFANSMITNCDVITKKSRNQQIQWLQNISQRITDLVPSIQANKSTIKKVILPRSGLMVLLPTLTVLQPQDISLGNNRLEQIQSILRLAYSTGNPQTLMTTTEFITSIPQITYSITR
ncbi:hypothetical protein KKE48_03440 [Patescibacteria group bacterium]|nr:hypothetical protein [Patescibacteria group bacterium]